MARLSDYGFDIDGLDNTGKVIIRGQEFPVVFAMETMEYIADVYNQDYSIFEKDMNDMLRRAEGEITSRNLTSDDLKIMRALVYGMLRTGGLEETPEAISRFLGMSNEVLTAYSQCMEIFAKQTFQVEDLKKSNKPQDFQTSKTQRKNVKRKNKKKR